jgi:MFS family permease
MKKSVLRILVPLHARLVLRCLAITLILSPMSDRPLCLNQVIRRRALSHHLTSESTSTGATIATICQAASQICKLPARFSLGELCSTLRVSNYFTLWSRCFFLANSLSWAVFTALPALFPSFEALFALSSTQLGLMRFIFACSQFLFSPFWSFVSHGKQKRVVVTECFICGCFCIGISFAPSYAAILACLAGVGFANGGIFPIAQSFLSDSFPVHQRGRMFGLLNVASFFGVAVGFIVATQVPTQVKTPLFTFSNWQIAFLILGILMVSTCFLIACIKHRVDYDHLQEQQTFVQQLRNVASSSTWRLIVIQGCFGMLPWDAISFMVLWFTLIGFSHQTAGLIMLTAACGAACGAVFGGWVGDKWSRSSPDSGRLSIAQVSLFLSLPASALFFEAVPRLPSSQPLYFGAIFALAFVCNWVGPACNEVIISEVVPRGSTSVAYALDRLFEGFFGSLGTLVVGVVADSQGYSYPSRVDVSSVPAALRTKNAAILGDAMLATCLTCWSIAFVM